MIYALIVLGFLCLLLLYLVIHGAEKTGGLVNENARIKDVLRASNIVHQRTAAIMDKFTKEQYNFFELAKTARSPNDYIQYANRLLDVDVPTRTTNPERTDPGSH